MEHAFDAPASELIWREVLFCLAIWLQKARKNTGGSSGHEAPLGFLPHKPVPSSGGNKCQVAFMTELGVWYLADEFAGLLCTLQLWGTQRQPSCPLHAHQV